MKCDFILFGHSGKLAVTRSNGTPVGVIHQQGRNREIHMGELPFLCTTEAAVAVRLSQHHGYWKASKLSLV